MRERDVDVDGREAPAGLRLDERVGVDAHLDDEINQRPALFAAHARKAVLS